MSYRAHREKQTWMKTILSVATADSNYPPRKRPELPHSEARTPCQDLGAHASSSLLLQISNPLLIEWGLCLLEVPEIARHRKSEIKSQQHSERCPPVSVVCAFAAWSHIDIEYIQQMYTVGHKKHTKNFLS